MLAVSICFATCSSSNVSILSTHSCLADVRRGSATSSWNTFALRMSVIKTLCASNDDAIAAIRVPGEIVPHSVCTTPSSIGHLLWTLEYILNVPSIGKITLSWNTHIYDNLNSSTYLFTSIYVIVLRNTKSLTVDLTWSYSQKIKKRQKDLSTHNFVKLQGIN